MSRRGRVWPPGARWLAAGIAAVVLALAVAWVLFVPAADWLARHDVGSAHGALLQTARDDARGRLLTLGAGLLAAGALLFTARNFTLSREGHVTDRYTKAIDQLGSDKLDVRIGGIYALERIARDSAKDHPTVMEVLAAFIREHSRDPQPEPDPDGQEHEQSIRPDVQAAVTVIGRQSLIRVVQRINLSRAKLPGVVLSGVILIVADLSGADLSGADLSSAVLGYANLSRADLSGADISGANLSGANLSRANLSGANLSVANLSRANLSRADLSGAELTAADLSGAQLIATNLTAAYWPEDKAVPRGWKRDPNSGSQLSREN